MGEAFRVVVGFSVIDACFESKDIFNEVHNLAEAPLKGSSDVFMMRSLLTLFFIILFPPNLLIIPKFHLCIYNPLLPSIITSMCLLISL